MLKNVLFYVFALLLLVVNVWFIQQAYYFFAYSQEQVIHHYLQAYPNIYKPLVFKEFYFTSSTYEQALWFSGLGAFLCCLLNFFYWKNRKFCKELLQETIKLMAQHLICLKKHLASLSWKEIEFLVFVVLGVIVSQVYRYNHVFVAMDEAFSWLFFTSQGVFVTLTNYPVPNNHIFYNFCSLFWSNFISDPILAMRFTSMLSFWALLLLIFYYFLKNTNFQTALLSLMFVGWGFSQSVFAVQGRGYMLLTLCFFVALWSMEAYLRNRQKAYLLFFAVSCIVGFWTIPVFLYVFLSFYAYLLFITWWKEKKTDLFLNLFKTGVLIGVAVYLCYCPVLLYSGFSALAGNENVSPKTYDSAWFFGYILSIALRESVIYVMSLPKYVSFVLFMVLGILLLYTSKKAKNASFLYNWTFLLISLPVTFFVICLMRAFPFYRVWTYYAVLLAVLLAYLAYYFVLSRRQVAYVWLIASNLLLSVGAYFQFWREIQDFYDPQAYQHHKNLQEASYDIIHKQQKVYLSAEAFYIRFWLEYAQKTHLIRQNPCKSDVAVTEIPEPAPLCQEKVRDIWFLKFYNYQIKN